MGWMPCCCDDESGGGVECPVCELSDPGAFKITLSGFSAGWLGGTFLLTQNGGTCFHSYFSQPWGGSIVVILNSVFLPQSIQIISSGEGYYGTAGVALADNEFEHCSLAEMIEHTYTSAAGDITFAPWYVPTGLEVIKIDAP
jgi:hypothetical protein